MIAYVPIGGYGTRLGLPYSKELLQTPGVVNGYEPLIANVVKLAKFCGANQIVLVDGPKLKPDVAAWSRAATDGVSPPCVELFAPGGILAFLSRIDVNEDALVLLPDVVYEKAYFKDFEKSMERVKTEAPELRFVAGMAVVPNDQAADRLSLLQEWEKGPYRTSDNGPLNSRSAWEALFFTARGLKEVKKGVETGALELSSSSGAPVLNYLSGWCCPSHFSRLFSIGKAYDVGSWAGHAEAWRALTPVSDERVL